MPDCSELSEILKAQIADKAKELFGLELPTTEDCETDKLTARRQVRDIVARIRGAAGKPDLLLQRNWEYGFYRNLVGGSVVAIVASVIGVYWHFDTTVGRVFIVFVIAYLIILLLSRWLLQRSAGHYTRQLFLAFLGDDR